MDGANMRQIVRARDLAAWFQCNAGTSLAMWIEHASRRNLPNEIAIFLRHAWIALN
jgi:hypothetical protein